MREPKKMGLLERKKFDRSQRRRKQRIKMGIISAVVVAILVVVCIKWQPWKLISFGPSVPANNKVESNKNDKKTKEQKKKLDELETRPVEFDEDCPELTDEQLSEFRRVSELRKEERRKKTVTIRLSSR